MYKSDIKKITKTRKMVDNFPIEYNIIDIKDKQCFVISEGETHKGSTADSMTLVKIVTDLFGKFTYATVPIKRNLTYTVAEDLSYLILVDEDENELHLTGLTCGYSGTGPHGMLKILNDLGFETNRRFIFSATSFELYHPSICNAYKLDQKYGPNVDYDLSY